jgi:hypothetical protein
MEAEVTEGAEACSSCVMLPDMGCNEQVLAPGTSDLAM